jgi:CheY-like chemotaxis protein
MSAEQKKLILVVDDDLDFLTQMQFQLESLGFEVKAVDTQEAAEEFLTHTRPAMAFLDLMMEKLDAGFVLAHKIKKLDKEIPVVMITAVTSETGMEFDTSAMGERVWIKADAVLAKPIRMEQLKAETLRIHG